MSDSPQPIVILGTGRSFTSVISCMIGEHPDMIGLPETNIFLYDTIGELLNRFGSGAKMRRLAGILRTLAYFHDGEQTDDSVEAAASFLGEHLHWTYRDIAEHFYKVAGPRGIVEKSISTCRTPENLARVRDAWPNAYFLHITRHPEAIVNSMQSRVDSALEKGKGRNWTRLMKEHSIDGYYNTYTTNVLEFMATLPQGQAMNLRGEDFLTDARSYTRQICAWAGLRGDDAAIEAMMHPENNPFANIGPAGAEMGMSATFIKNPFYSGEPVAVKPMTFQAEDIGLDVEKRKMALLGNRLGYA